MNTLQFLTDQTWAFAFAALSLFLIGPQLSWPSIGVWFACAIVLEVALRIRTRRARSKERQT